jgi:hypothetical protein
MAERTLDLRVHLVYPRYSEFLKGYNYVSRMSGDR